jgi:hypothetical protein
MDAQAEGRKLGVDYTLSRLFRHECTHLSSSTKMPAVSAAAPSFLAFSTVRRGGVSYVCTPPPFMLVNLEPSTHL